MTTDLSLSAAKSAKVQVAVHSGDRVDFLHKGNDGILRLQLLIEVLLQLGALFVDDGLKLLWIEV